MLFNWQIHFTPAGLMKIAFFAVILAIFSFFDIAYGQIRLSVLAPDEAKDFISEGYASVPLAISLAKDGKPLSGTLVRLKIAAAENHCAALPDPAGTGITGLSWRKAAPAGQNALTEMDARTDENGNAEAVLTDIIGEREVVILASYQDGNEEARAEQTVRIGKGPLSIFASPPPAEPLTWLELYETCNGRPYDGDPADWDIGAGLKGGEKMPTLEQMLAVSLPGPYNKQKNALGVGLAAGWPTDMRYWNGRAVMKSRASHVNIQDGNFHGSDGNDVNGKQRGICLK